MNKLFTLLLAMFMLGACNNNSSEGVEDSIEKNAADNTEGAAENAANTVEQKADSVETELDND